MQIIFVDSWYVAVVKPPGVAVQSREAPERSLVAVLRNDLGEPELQPCHRIDQRVSGIVLLARHAAAFSAFQRALADGVVRRSYLAVVAGVPEPDADTLVDRLLVDSRHNRTIVASEGKEARLSYRIVGATRHHTVLLVQLDTGRHHQIRVQLAARGWPIVGDTRYGARRPTRDRSLALHALALRLPHPLGGMIPFTAPPPDAPVWRGVRLGPNLAREDQDVLSAFFDSAPGDRGAGPASATERAV